VRGYRCGSRLQAPPLLALWRAPPLPPLLRAF
jgi:hypothetical protein